MPEPLRVLIVDDSEDDATLLLRQLRQGGWEPAHVRVDTADAMSAALDQGGWKLIISDFSMPQFSGFDALTLLRKRNVDPPFILVSGNVGEETAVEAMKSGANDYLFKGNLKRLGPVVERELREAAQRRESQRMQTELRNRDTQIADAQRLAHLGTWHVNVIAQTAAWSEETCRIVGRQPAGGSLTFSEFLLCLHPEDRASLADAIQSASASQFALDCCVVRPDGQTRRVHICGDIIRGENSKALEASGMIQDITERELAEEELERYRRHLERLVAERTADLQTTNLRLQAEMTERKRVESHMIFSEKMASLGQLVAGIAHEINNPLSFVINNIATLRRDTAALGKMFTASESAGSAPPQADQPNLQEMTQNLNETLNSSRDGLDRIRKIVAGLRDFVRLDEDDLSDVDLNAGINSTVNMLRHKADAEKIQLELDLHPIPSVSCYPAKINQVIMNLVANAIDASAAGGKIIVRSAPDGDGVRVEVIDHGQGIDPVIRGKIFDPFFTTKPPGKGTGLGLSISYGIIRDHDGRIDVESTVGAGSRFAVWIPQHKAA